MAIRVIAGAPACANCPTSVRRSVTEPRAGATTSSTFEIQLGLLDRRACTQQLRVLFTAFARCFLCLAQIRLGFLLLTLGRDPAGLRTLDAADRERAWIFGMDLFQSRRILLCVDMICHSRLQ